MHDEGTARIPLLAGDGAIKGYALVDASDLEWLSQWTWGLTESQRGVPHVTRYESRPGGGVVVRMHRQICGLAQGHVPEVDHINHDTLDNRRTNLRVVTHAQNMQNRARGYAKTSRFRGVRFVYGKWTASAKLNGRSTHIGAFTTESEAQHAVQWWRAMHMPFSVEAAMAAQGLLTEPLPPARRPATSTRRGIYWHAAKRRWVVLIRVDGRRRELGLFATEDLAIEAQRLWEEEHLPSA